MYRVLCSTSLHNTITHFAPGDTSLFYHIIMVFTEFNSYGSCKVRAARSSKSSTPQNRKAWYPTDTVNPTTDELPDAGVISNPENSVWSKITEEMLGRICLRHRPSLKKVRLPGPKDRARNPPKRFTACNRFMSWTGTMPSFNQFISDVLFYLRIAPSQLHPDGYALLNSLYIIFLEHLFRSPIVDGIRYLFNIRVKQIIRRSPSWKLLGTVKSWQAHGASWAISKQNGFTWGAHQDSPGGGWSDVSSITCFVANHDQII